MSVALDRTLDPAVPSFRADLDIRIRLAVEAIAIPVLALLASAVIFSLFLLVQGKSPMSFFQLMWTGGFGTWFSLQNTLQRAAPLLLTALCVAIPAQLGLVVIGGEGALVLGGLAAAAVALPLLGALCIGLVGVLRHYRGVNETISSLLIAYIAIAVMNHIVEGPLRDPASLNKPSTRPIGEAYMLGNIPGLDVHWGLVVGVVACIGAWVLMGRTTFGFAARITGGNARAAMLQGLPVGRLMVAACALAGACAGLAGMLEVAAVHGNANASLVAGYGYTGILVAFLARQNPVAIMPVALFFGGIVASGGLIQRRLGLPDATTLVLQGIIFVTILVSETLYGRFKIFQPKGPAA